MHKNKLILRDLNKLMHKNKLILRDLNKLMHKNKLILRDLPAETSSSNICSYFCMAEVELIAGIVVKFTFVRILEIGSAICNGRDCCQIYVCSHEPGKNKLSHKKTSSTIFKAHRIYVRSPPRPSSAVCPSSTIHKGKLSHKGKQARLAGFTPKLSHIRILLSPWIWMSPWKKNLKKMFRI
jgi:hypothetical protein